MYYIETFGKYGEYKKCFRITYSEITAIIISKIAHF